MIVTEIYAWISSVNRLNEELQTVYQKLWEQSVVLKNFVAPVLRDASHSTGAKRGKQFIFHVFLFAVLKIIMWQCPVSL